LAVKDDIAVIIFDNKDSFIAVARHAVEKDGQRPSASKVATILLEHALRLAMNSGTSDLAGSGAYGMAVNSLFRAT
jgi:hypothetical protein